MVEGTVNPVCEMHDTPKKHVPAGTSKRTGKEYNAFWVCDACSEERRGAKRGASDPAVLEALKFIQEDIARVLKGLTVILDEVKKE